MDALLHEENIIRIPLLGKSMKRRLVKRISETQSETKMAADPGVSIVIRSKNNAQQLKALLQDIRGQDYDGKIEVIVVDTESNDNSVSIAQKFDAKIVTMTQAEFNYPRGLNLGFKTATQPWVFTCVDHSALASRYVLKTITRWDANGRIAGIWSYPLPNANATAWERFGYGLWIWGKLKSAHKARKYETGMGFMGANNMAVRRNIWEGVGGFDECYAAGGEDLVLGKAIIKAGYEVIYDPSLSVFHTHGLGLIGLWRQFQYWRHTMRPSNFDVSKLRRYRSDL